MQLKSLVSSLEAMNDGMFYRSFGLFSGRVSEIEFDPGGSRTEIACVVSEELNTGQIYIKLEYFKKLAS
jgi:hypothetical protein